MIAAGTASILVGFTLLIGPMLVFRALADIPIDAEGPSGEIWLLILGCGLGPGGGYLTFYSVMSWCGFSEKEIDIHWPPRTR